VGFPHGISLFAYDIRRHSPLVIDAAGRRDGYCILVATAQIQSTPKGQDCRSPNQGPLYPGFSNFRFHPYSLAVKYVMYQKPAGDWVS